MEARARNKRETQTQPKKSTHYAALPWRYGKRSETDKSERSNTASRQIVPSQKPPRRSRRQSLVANPLHDSSQSSSEHQSPVSSPGTSRSGSETGQQSWLTHVDELVVGLSVQPQSPFELGEDLLGPSEWPNLQYYQGSTSVDSECASERVCMLQPFHNSTGKSEHERLVSLSTVCSFHRTKLILISRQARIG
jgi:hypothetical protein